MTQIQFAEALNVTMNTVQNWESGRHKPNRTSLTKICQIFKVEMDWLLKGTGPMHKAGQETRQMQVTTVMAAVESFKYIITKVEGIIRRDGLHIMPDKKADIITGLYMYSMLEPEGHLSEEKIEAYFQMN